MESSRRFPLMLSVPISINKVLRQREFTIPQAINMGLLILHTAANLFQLFVLPLYFLPKSIGWSLMLVPIAVLNNPLWALLHESIHDVFNASFAVNRAAGRWLSVLFGSPFEIL